MSPRPAPRRHPPAEALLAWAAGHATPGEELLLACHLTACPDCRSAVEAAEAAGADLAFATPAEDVGPPPAALLERLAAPAPPRAPPGEGLPRPLLARFGPPEALRWRALPGGCRVARLSAAGDRERVLLVDFPAGFAVPAHTHVGVERSVVLGGGFALAGVGDHEVGDVTWTDGPHAEVRVHATGPCRTLFVNDGPLSTGRWLVDRVYDALLLR